jgi:hypothetical protein
VTVNLWAKDLETERLFLEIFGPEGATQMPPAETRIGALIDGRDRWWKADEPDGPGDLARSVLKYGLPWFERVQTLEDQAELWFFRSTALTAPGYLGPSAVGLALTLYRLGRTAEACEILARPVTKTANPTVVHNVRRLREWLRCDGAGEGRQGPE